MILLILRTILTYSFFFVGSTILLILILLGAGGDEPAYFYSRNLLQPILKILGIRLEIRGQENLRSALPCVFVANHQSIQDLFVHGSYFPKGTITIGKRSLRFIPIFGWIFVACGCILIDRSKRSSALASMAFAAREMINRQRSVFVFPEGTRSGRRGLLPFKSGAFHLAVQSKRPVVALVASSYYLSLNLRRWNSGTVIIQCLPPVSTLALETEHVPALMAIVHRDVERCLARLNAEMAQRRPDLTARAPERNS